MFINEVSNYAELSAIIINDLRDLYGIKFRKEKKSKNHEVSDAKQSTGKLNLLVIMIRKQHLALYPSKRVYIIYA